MAEPASSFRGVRRWLLPLALLGLGMLLGALWAGRKNESPVADPPALVERVREVVRLETLEVSLYKKVSFAPEPAIREGLWGQLAEWVRYSLAKPEGRAILFADVHLGLDLTRLDARSIQVRGDVVEVTLPALRAVVELKPGETEVIGSNLDSLQTAQLFEKAKTAFEGEVLADPALRARALGSAERAIRALLLTAGFRRVDFVRSVEVQPAR